MINESEAIEFKNKPMNLTFEKAHLDVDCVRIKLQ